MKGRHYSNNSFYLRDTCGSDTGERRFVSIHLIKKAIVDGLGRWGGGRENTMVSNTAPMGGNWTRDKTRSRPREGVNRCWKAFWSVVGSGEGEGECRERKKTTAFPDGGETNIYWGSTVGEKRPEVPSLFGIVGADGSSKKKRQTEIVALSTVLRSENSQKFGQRISLR